jgi:hypothetical protein
VIVYIIVVGLFLAVVALSFIVGRPRRRDEAPAAADIDRPNGVTSRRHGPVMARPIRVGRRPSRTHQRRRD